MTQRLIAIPLAIAAVCSAGVLAARAQPSGAPQWDALPTGEAVSRAYPARAVRERVEGRGVVTCRVNARGNMEECAVTSETPAGYGFGAAALSLAPRFRLRMAGGPVAAGGQVSIPLGFRLPAGETATPPAPEGTLAEPNWASQPQRAQIVAAYPAAAPQANRVRAFVVLDCTTDESGTPRNCAPAAEDPAAQGFGQAAIGLASSYRLAASQPGGASIAGAKVRLVVAF